MWLRTCLMRMKCDAALEAFSCLRRSLPWQSRSRAIAYPVKREARWRPLASHRHRSSSRIRMAPPSSRLRPAASSPRWSPARKRRSTCRRCHRRCPTMTGRSPRSPANTPSSPPSCPRVRSRSSSSWFVHVFRQLTELNDKSDLSSSADQSMPAVPSCCAQVIPARLHRHLPEARVPATLLCRGRSWAASYCGDLKCKKIDAAWRDFAVDNGLRVGDACVFELVTPAAGDGEEVVFRVQVLRGDLPEEITSKGATSDEPLVIVD